MSSAGAVASTFLREGHDGVGEAGAATGTHGAATTAPRPIHIPLTRSTHTFKELHIQRINETEANMIQQVKRTRKKWEKEVDQMNDELLKLHPTDDSDRASNASDRSDSSDSFDPQHHAGAYFENPDNGKRRFQVRFKVKDFKQDSIKMTVDNGRIKVTAIKVEKRSNGTDREVRFTKKIKKPAGVRPEDLISKLTSDGVLLIEAPVKPKQHAHREAYSHIPMEHSSLTFKNSQKKQMDRQQEILADAVKERKKKYEKEVKMMQEEFLTLYRADQPWDTSLPHPDPLVIHRMGSIDIMDHYKMRSLYYENPDTGLRTLRLRFNVRGFDLSSIKIRIESEAIVVRASKIEKSSADGSDVSVEYVRKVQIPTDVNAAKIKSNLTKDGILDVQVPAQETFLDDGATTDDDLKTPTVEHSSADSASGPNNKHGFYLDDASGEEDDNDDGIYSDDRVTTPVNREIPLSRDVMTFSGIHKEIAENMEGRLTRDVQKKRIQWEIDVKQMHKEFLKLYPADKDWGSDDFLQDPFIKKRTGSTEVLNVEEMRSLYHEDEGTGRMIFRLRFDVKEYDKKSVTVIRESDRMSISASIEDEDAPDGKETFVRKIKMPHDVDIASIKSYLTKDGILTVEAPSSRKTKPCKPTPTPNASPYHMSSSMHMSTSMSAYSVGSEKGPPKLPKPNLPMFNKIQGVKHLLLVVQLGTEFDPRDVTVQANSTSSIKVKAKHTEVTKERYSKHKFHRDYELPEKIEQTSLRAGLRTDGLLIIAALAKGESMMGNSISLKSLYLGNAEACNTESE